MAVNMSYLLAPRSFDFAVKNYDVRRTQLTIEEDDAVRAKWISMRDDDTTLRYGEIEGELGMEGFTTKDAWDHLRSADARPEESYAVKLRNDFNIVEATGHSEVAFNRMHDPRPLNLKAYQTGEDPYANREGFVRQYLHLCSKGYACALSQQWPAFLPRIFIPLEGEVRYTMFIYR